MPRTPPTHADMLQAKFDELEALVRNCLLDNINYQPVRVAGKIQSDGFYFTHYPSTRSYVEGPLRKQAEGILDRIAAVKALAIETAVTPAEQKHLDALSEMAS